MTNDITLVRDTDSALLETTAEKYENIESELNEIKDNLIDAAAKLAVQLPIAIQLAEASQNDKIYTALAKLVVAFSTLNKDAAGVIKQKQDLFDSFRQKVPPQTQQPEAPQDNRQIHFHGTANDLLDKFLHKDK